MKWKKLGQVFNPQIWDDGFHREWMNSHAQCTSTLIFDDYVRVYFSSRYPKDENNQSTWNLPAEFNDLKHKHGILSMARSNHPDSGGSQFFVCAGDVPHLDNQYTVFGQVIEGNDVIDQIVNLQRDGNDNPLERVEMKVVIENRST